MLDFDADKAGPLQTLRYGWLLSYDSVGGLRNPGELKTATWDADKRRPEPRFPLSSTNSLDSSQLASHSDAVCASTAPSSGAACPARTSSRPYPFTPLHDAFRNALPSSWNDGPPSSPINAS